MLTDEEEKFIKFWEVERDNPFTVLRQFRVGLTIGLVMGGGIILSYVSGWYKRANMVANSQSTPLMLLIALTIITIFCSIFYKHFRRDMNEQRYKELLYKKQKENLAAGKQQEEINSSHGI